MTVDNMLRRAVRGLEDLLFGHRLLVVGLFCLATAALLWAAAHAHLEAGLDKQAPADHPFIQTAERYGDGRSGNGLLLIALEAKTGTIFTAPFFEEFQQVADDLFYLPGTDRAHLTHMFASNVRVVELTEDGFRGSAVVPDKFAPSEAGFEQVKTNLLKGGFVGQLVSGDFRSALIAVPLLSHEPKTAAPLDYLGFVRRLDSDIKEKYEARYPDVRIRITGAAWAAGEIARGARYVVAFFLAALAITAFLLHRVSHHWWLTAAPLLCSLAAVVWQIGLVTLFGYGIDVYSVLIPFLILSIGVSHGVQMILSTGQLAASGADSRAAARQSFRRLFLPGSIALITAVVTFLTITTIRIPVIRELAATATIGIAALAFTNLIWLPVMVSYARITPQTIARMRSALDRRERFWHLLAILVRPRYAAMLTLGAAVIAVTAGVAAQGLVVGDLTRGTPELRPSSRFNQDTLYILDHFANGADSLVVYATDLRGACPDPRNLRAVDDFAADMRFVPGVHATRALPDRMKSVRVIENESDIRWSVISHERGILRAWDEECTVMPVTLYLGDHRAATLSGIVRAVEDYNAGQAESPIKLRLAGGNGGQMAAINQAVDAAQTPMMALVYLAMVIICGLTFRSVRAVLCIILPLALVSLIANGAMALLGIGLKVSTLPVAALGVGIGVDYGIYKFSRLSHYMSQGMSLQDAYIQTLRETGSAVIFTGLTLSAGVATWVLSPLQFQADMGLLLTLMFFMNMVGAIVLLPALIGIMQMIRPQRAEDMARSSVLHQSV
jgi:predicted RND superfamily exporter protein